MTRIAASHDICQGATGPPIRQSTTLARTAETNLRQLLHESAVPLASEGFCLL